MPAGTISSSRDTVGVAVVNYQVPVVRTKEEVLGNCNRISDFVDGAKRGYPGLDLIVFPEYSTQGFHPSKWLELSTTVPGPETEIFAKACRRNNVWGVFSIAGEINSHANPWNSLLIINKEGEIVMNYHAINPWTPQEPWHPGEQTFVVEGPKGIKLGGMIGYDSNIPEMCRDTALKGAELIVSIQGYMTPLRDQQRMISQVRAWENLAYLAVSNLSGRDQTYSYFGYSGLVNFDGSVIAECDGTPDQVTYGLLSLSGIRDSRKHWTTENHLYNLNHRGAKHRDFPKGEAKCPYAYIHAWANQEKRLQKETERITRSKRVQHADIEILKS